MKRPGRSRRSLARRGPSRTPRQRILVICGGGTEARYFWALVKAWRLDPLVEIGVEGQGLDPKSVVEVAVRRKKTNERQVRRGEAASIDSIWCVLDKEGSANRPPAMPAAADQARHHSIRIAWSEPCFEFWVLLHFEHTSAPFENCERVIQRLKQFLPGYEKNRDYADELLPKLDKAIDSARRLKGADVLSSSLTDVFLVVEDLRALK